MAHVFDFFFELVRATVAGGGFCLDPLRPRAERSELHMKYNRLVAQLSGVT